MAATTSEKPATGELLTVPEVAALVRAHRVTIYRAISTGRLRAIRLGAGGPLRVSEDALDAYCLPAFAPGDPTAPEAGSVRSTV